MGITSIPRELFIEMLADLRPRYNMTSYDLIKNNCNNFTNDVVTFLTGRPIPPCALLFYHSRVGLCHPLLTASSSSSLLQSSPGYRRRYTTHPRSPPQQGPTSYCEWIGLQVLNTPMGAMFRPMVEQMQNRMRDVMPSEMSSLGPRTTRTIPPHFCRGRVLSADAETFYLRPS
jgi:hypothetical protein